MEAAITMIITSKSINVAINPSKLAIIRNIVAFHLDMFKQAETAKSQTFRANYV